MATTKKAAGKTAKNVSKNGAKSASANNQAKFAGVFEKCKTAEEAKKILDYLVNGYTEAYNAKYAKAAKNGSAKGKADTKTKAKKAEKEEVPQVLITDKKGLKKLNLKWTDYSDKSFSISGDTKPAKDILKELGGVYNHARECWFFSKKKSEKEFKKQMKGCYTTVLNA